MVAYDSTATYDGASALYDGVQLGAVATLLVNGADRTAYLKAGSLAVRVATHGNSLGTLDAELVDPPALPATEQAVRLYIGTTSRYAGTVRATTTRLYHDDHLFAAFSCQDSGPDGGLPSAAPFDLSDAPNGTSLRGWQRLERQTRTTEAGAAKATYSATVRESGLWANQNIELTSDAYGLAAVELTIRELQLRWPALGAPEYTLTLGDPLVSLYQVVTELDPNIEAGSITATEISDGAISTPKLAANAVTAAKITAGTITATELATGSVTADKVAASAVTADKVAANAITSAKFATDAEAPEVRNSTGQVIIDSTGVAITGGKLSVTNPGGTVIIDGTSDMFRIVATGTFTGPSLAGAGQASTYVDVATGLTYPPAYLMYLEASAGTIAIQLPYFIWQEATGNVFDHWEGTVTVVSTNQTRVKCNLRSSRANSAYTIRYYLLKQSAI